MSIEYNGFKIVSDKKFGLKEIKQIGKGALPRLLVGKFTTPLAAKRVIDSYILSKEGNERAKTVKSD